MAGFAVQRDSPCDRLVPIIGSKDGILFLKLWLSLGRVAVYSASMGSTPTACG